MTERLGCEDCGFLGGMCICNIKAKHVHGCQYLKAASLYIELACEHGYQACPICDECDCGVGESEGHG